MSQVRRRGTRGLANGNGRSQDFQAEAFVGGLLWSERRARGDQLTGGHVFGGTIDGIDCAEPAVAEVEDREIAVFRLPSHGGGIEARAPPENLDREV
jgi:hypothetical protein